MRRSEYGEVVVWGKWAYGAISMALYAYCPLRPLPLCQLLFTHIALYPNCSIFPSFSYIRYPIGPLPRTSVVGLALVNDQEKCFAIEIQQRSQCRKSVLQFAMLILCIRL